MTGNRSLLALALVCAQVACGCGVASFVDAGGPPVADVPALAARAGAALLGASERTMFEETDTDVDGYAPPKPRRTGFAVRAGVFSLGATDAVTYDPGFSVGLSFDVVRGGAFSLEVSADHTDVADASGERTSTLILLGAGARYVPGGGSFYLLGFASLVVEDYVDGLTGDAASGAVPLFGVGLGLRPGGLDLRVGYSMPLAGGGPGAIAACGGYAF